MKNVTHNNEGVTPATGNDTRRYALVLLERGVSYSDVAKETGISVSNLRVMKNRMKAAKNDALQSVTPVTDSVTEEVTQDKSVTPEPEPVTKKRFTGWELEAVYYVTTLGSCYAFILAIPGFLGYVVAGVYLLLSYNSLNMAKNADIPQTAAHGKNRVWALETVAFFADYYAISQAMAEHPFKINGVWQSHETINIICIALAVLLPLSAIEAVSTRLKLTKETNEQAIHNK